MLPLRPYQHDLLHRVQDALAEKPKARLMLQLPTGGGKTVIAGSLLADWLQDGRKAVWLTHRKELAEQTQRMLTDAGVSAIINVNWASDGAALAMSGGAIILMAQTVGLRATSHEVWNRYDADDLLIIDEAHHATAPGWERAMRQWPGPIVGMTATPWRLSKKEGFDHLFCELLCGPQTADLQALEPQPALCRAQVLIPSQEQRIVGGAIDRTGDYTEAGITQANSDRPNVMTAGALAFWQKHAEGRQTIAYAVSVNHANNLAAVFKDAGVSADVILGESNQKRTERDAAIAGFRKGDIKVLVNVLVATEGFDLPDASCIIVARPTMSLALYLQMVGRGLRPKPEGADYTDCLILDLAANVETHGLPEDYREWSLEPRGTQPGGDAPVVICPRPECEATSPAASHYCRVCGYSFGKDCGRCGRWRSHRRWQYETHCGDQHQQVCDLCHIDAHIRSHLPIAPPLDQLVELYISEDEMMFPNDAEFDDDLANRLCALFRELLESERQSVIGADDARREELLGWIGEIESVLGDDDELDRRFDEYMEDKSKPASHAGWSRSFVEWEVSLQAELVFWRWDLAELESRAVDKQAIFNSARSKAMHILWRVASDTDLLPDRSSIDGSQGTLATAASLGSDSPGQPRVGRRSTVMESAIYWLCYVAAEHNGQTVGLAYDKVLEKVLEEHPSAKTTRYGIAYYASHIKRRKKGYEHGTLPDIRPQSSWL